MTYININRIGKNLINQLPVLKYKGKIVIVREEESLIQALEDIYTAGSIGFDTESRPSFKKGVTHPVSIIQCSTHEKVFIIQLKYVGMHKKLAEMLESEKIEKIGIGLKNDYDRLKNDYNVELKTFTDLSAIASSKGIIQVWARCLTVRYFGKRLAKSARTTNWAKNVLTKKQLIYAATDAWISLKLYPLLNADTTDYKKIGLIEEEILNSDHPLNNRAIS